MFKFSKSVTITFFKNYTATKNFIDVSHSSILVFEWRTNIALGSGSVVVEVVVLVPRIWVSTRLVSPRRFGQLT